MACWYSLPSGHTQKPRAPIAEWPFATKSGLNPSPERCGFCGIIMLNRANWLIYHLSYIQKAHDRICIISNSWLYRCFGCVPRPVRQVLTQCSWVSQHRSALSPNLPKLEAVRFPGSPSVEQPRDKRWQNRCYNWYVYIYIWLQIYIYIYNIYIYIYIYMLQLWKIDAVLHFCSNKNEKKEVFPCSVAIVAVNVTHQLVLSLNYQVEIIVLVWNHVKSFKSLGRN